MRRRISAGRAELRRGVQIVVAVTVGFAVFLVVFGRDYIAPYGTPAGQVALAVVVGIFAAGVRLDAETVRCSSRWPRSWPAPGTSPDPADGAAAGHPDRTPTRHAAPAGGGAPVIAVVAAGRRCSGAVLFALLLRLVAAAGRRRWCSWRQFDAQHARRPARGAGRGDRSTRRAGWGSLRVRAGSVAGRAAGAAAASPTPACGRTWR